MMSKVYSLEKQPFGQWTALFKITRDWQFTNESSQSLSYDHCSDVRLSHIHLHYDVCRLTRWPGPDPRGYMWFKLIKHWGQSQNSNLSWSNPKCQQNWLFWLRIMLKLLHFSLTHISMNFNSTISTINFTWLYLNHSNWTQSFCN